MPPVGTNNSNPEDEDAIVVEKVVGLPEDGLVPADSNVLGMAIVNSPNDKKTAYMITSAISRLTILLKEPFCGGIISVVHAKNAGAALLTHSMSSR